MNRDSLLHSHFSNIKHIASMQNLLEQFNAENHYLSKQVQRLLEIKQLKQNSRLKETGKTSKIQTKHFRQSSGKKKYDYVSEAEQYEQELRQQTNRKEDYGKYSPIGRVSNKDPKQFKYVTEQHSSPEITSRFLTEEEISLQKHNKQKQLVPILKNQTELSRSSSPDRRSSRSKSSRGISVVSNSQRKAQREENERFQQSPNKMKIQQQNGSTIQNIYKNNSPNKINKRVSFDETVLKNSKNSRISQRQTISKTPAAPYQSSPPHKSTINYSQVGINTQPSPIVNQNSYASFMKTRSLSQHRIQPSEKVAYSEQQSQLSRKSSQQMLRPASRDSSKDKKKFINIVSNKNQNSLLLAHKLNQGTNQLNKVYK